MSCARGELVNRIDSIPISPLYQIIPEDETVHFFHLLTGKISTTYSFNELLENFTKAVESRRTLSDSDVFFAKMMGQLRKDAEKQTRKCYPSYLPQGSGSSDLLFSGKAAQPKPFLDEYGSEADTTDTSSPDFYDRVDRSHVFDRTRYASNTWQVCTNSFLSPYPLIPRSLCLDVL